MLATTPETTAPVLLVTVDEAKRALSVHKATIFRLLAAGELESVIIGRARRITVASLHD